MKRSKYILLAISSLFTLLVLWWVSVKIFSVREFFLPTPPRVLQALQFLFSNGNFLQDIGISIFRILVGFTLACVFAVPVGILMGRSQVYEALFEPFIDFVRYIPVPAFVPLFILWFGIGELEKIIVIASSVFFQLVLMVAKSVSEIPLSTIQSAQTLGVHGTKLITHIVYPYSKPKIAHDIRISLGWAWAALMMAEIVGATSGIGYVITQSQRLLQTPNVLAGMMVVGFLGLTSDYLCKYTHKKMFPWYSM